MATARNREAREQRERARVYETRVKLHDERIRRRRRDDILGLVIGGIVVLGAVGGQALFYTVGPGAAEDAEVTPAPVEQTPVD